MDKSSLLEIAKNVVNTARSKSDENTDSEHTKKCRNLVDHVGILITVNEFNELAKELLVSMNLNPTDEDTEFFGREVVRISFACIFSSNFTPIPAN